MITHVKTKGFKGFDINEDIPEKALFCGKNRSGKSTRSAAIALAILGYIPFATRSSKRPGDILDDFGVGESLTVAVVCNNVEFERHFTKSKEGSVSQRLRVDKKKYSAQDFAIELFKAGAPKIIDVNEFMALSDQKKLDTIFSLFPPAGNLKDIDSKIEKAKKTISDLQTEDRTSVSVIQRLTKSKTDIVTPAGNLAEIRADIEKLTKQVRDAQDDLKAAEIEQAKTEAAGKAAKDTMIIGEKSQVAFDRIMEEKEKDAEKEKNAKREKDAELDRMVEEYFSDPPNEVHTKQFSFNHDPAESIQKIIDVLKDSGCEICAAVIVAKQELKKFKKGVAV